LNQLSDTVRGFEQDADPIRSGDEHTGADERQHFFRLVRQFADLAEFEHTGTTFDRMDGAEDPMYPLRIAFHGASFQCEQVRLHGFQVIEALRLKLFT
jgi:hypothetical protein